MKIQVNSDKAIPMEARSVRSVEGRVNRALSRFKDRLSRVELHFSDQNGVKRGVRDKRCLLEARPLRRQPLVTQMSAATVGAAVSGALTKMRKALDTHFGRADDAAGKRRTTTSGGAGKTDKAGSPETRPPAHKHKTSSQRTRKSMAAKGSGKRVTAGGRRPKKKGIYQARRKSWPQR